MKDNSISHETWLALPEDQKAMYGPKTTEMYDDNPGYEEWIKSDNPDRDRRNGYITRSVHYPLPQSANDKSKRFDIVDSGKQLLKYNCEVRIEDKDKPEFIIIVEGANFSELEKYAQNILKVLNNE